MWSPPGWSPSSRCSPRPGSTGKPVSWPRRPRGLPLPRLLLPEPAASWFRGSLRPCRLRGSLQFGHEASLQPSAALINCLASKGERERRFKLPSRPKQIDSRTTQSIKDELWKPFVSERELTFRGVHVLRAHHQELIIHAAWGGQSQSLLEAPPTRDSACRLAAHSHQPRLLPTRTSRPGPLILCSLESPLAGSLQGVCGSHWKPVSASSVLTLCLGGRRRLSSRWSLALACV